MNWTQTNDINNFTYLICGMAIDGSVHIPKFVTMSFSGRMGIYISTIGLTNNIGIAVD